MVCASMILHHIKYPEEIIQEFHRVLRPNGILFIADLLPHDDEEFRINMHDYHSGINPAELEHWLLDTGFGSIGIERLTDMGKEKKNIFVLTAIKAERV